MTSIVADRVFHPEIVVGFSSTVVGEIRSTTFILETYTQIIIFSDLITLDNLRMNNAGNGSNSFELVENDVVVARFEQADFEDGRQIYGLGYWGSSLP